MLAASAQKWSDLGYILKVNPQIGFSVRLDNRYENKKGVRDAFQTFDLSKDARMELTVTGMWKTTRGVKFSFKYIKVEMPISHHYRRMLSSLGIHKTVGRLKP